MKLHAGMGDGMGMYGEFHGVVWQHKAILRALESNDPEELVHAMRSLKIGSMAGYEKTNEFTFPNTVVDEYRNRVLELGIGGSGAGAAVSTNIRMGLFDNDVTPGRTTTLAGLDSAVNEFYDYTVSSGNTTNRAPYTAAVAASQSISNAASPASFTFTGTGTIRGAFVEIGSTLKGDQGGNQDDVSPNILVSIGRLTADQPIAAGGAQIDFTYTQGNDT